MIENQIDYGLNILFIGINPHPGSYRRGVPFSNNKMFWYLLHAAGILHESREVLKNDVLLKKLYLGPYKTIYRLGLLNMSDRPTRTASEITKQEAREGRQRIITHIYQYQPKVVCFVGKITYQLFSATSQVTYGWQPNIGESKIYVMHAPHRGFMHVRVQQLQEIMQAINL